MISMHLSCSSKFNFHFNYKTCIDDISGKNIILRIYHGDHLAMKLFDSRKSTYDERAGHLRQSIFVSWYGDSWNYGIASYDGWLAQVDISVMGVAAHLWFRERVLYRWNNYTAVRYFTYFDDAYILQAVLSASR